MNGRELVGTRSRSVITTVQHDTAPPAEAGHSTAAETGGSRPRILLVEDDPMAQRTIGRLLQRQGYEVEIAGSAVEGLGLLTDRAYRVTLVDYYLPDIHGPEFIERARTIQPQMVFVGISGQFAIANCNNLMTAGAVDYFDKSQLNDQRFQQVIQGALREGDHARDSKLRLKQLAELTRDGTFSQLLGNSHEMEQLKLDIDMVARHHQLNVLVLGPSGSGKERVAQAVHQVSQVSGPFVARSMADLSESLFESEIFGHKKGAFTGATEDRAGLFELAAGGTLFLDEIGCLPMPLQAKLLRVLQERKFNRVGCPTQRRFSGRLVCATNEDLDQLVKEGKFREDLLFRIKDFTLQVPSLDKRKSDIPQLAYHFLETFNEGAACAVEGFEPNVIQALQSHSWAANNVRELRNVIRQCAVQASYEASLQERLPDKLHVRLRHLPPYIRRSFDEQPATPGVRTAEANESLIATVDAFAFPGKLFSMTRKEAKELVTQTFEREYVTRALEAHDYNVTRAARAAGMQRPNFKRLMNKLDVRVPSSR